MLKKCLSALRFVFYLTAYLFEFLLSYLAISLVFSLIQFAQKPIQKNEQTLPVFLYSSGVHLELILPIKSVAYDWTKRIPYSAVPANDSTVQWISFGWGEKNFFLQTPTWADFKLKNMLKSLFFMGQSAMHIRFIHQIQATEKYICLHLSTKQYNALIKAIGNEFDTNSAGQFVFIPQNVYSQYDAFYKTRSAYNLFNTCNSFSNYLLKVSGQKHCLWTPFSYVLYNAYRHFNEE
jgi:uncharacterized protein (TIGR02117 family)